MSASGQFARDGIDRGGEDRVVVPVRPAREPIDLDKVQVVAWAVVGAALYLGFAIASAVALTMTFGAWVGCLTGLLAGTLPAAYSLVKAHQRSAAREARAHQSTFRGEEPTAHRAALQVRP